MWLWLACSSSPPLPAVTAPADAPRPAPPAAAPIAPPPAADVVPPELCPPPPAATAIPFDQRPAGQAAREDLAQGCAWEAVGGAPAWADALRYYRAVLQVDRGPGAHYLVARAIARLQADDSSNVCVHDAYTSDLLDALIAAGADPALRARLASDPLFVPYHGAVRYRVATGQSPTAIAAAASGLVLYGPAMGVYGNVEVVTLGDGGAAVVRRRDTETGAWSETRLPSAWKADGDALQLDVGRGPTRAVIGATGDIGDPNTGWDDAPSECEA